jgi:hypothetical protein
MSGYTLYENAQLTFLPLPHPSLLPLPMQTPPGHPDVQSLEKAVCSINIYQGPKVDLLIVWQAYILEGFVHPLFLSPPSPLR